MVAVYGDLSVQDDYTHPLGPEPNFNESMYFNFFDRARRSGGFLRLGNRANEGSAEMTVTLYMPDGSVLFQYGRPEISSNDAMDAGGMKFEVIEPMRRLRTTYDGPAVHLTDPTQMADPGAAFRNNPRKRVQVDLVHESAGPVYGSSGGNRKVEDPEKEFAKAHYEQHMRVQGTVRVDGEDTRIDGLGLRDHSWGPRYWQAIWSYRWLTINFAPDFGMMVSVVNQTPESRRESGVVVRGDTIEQITGVDIDTQFDAGGLYHRSLAARLTLASGEKLDVTGQVMSFIPLRNRRGQQTTHVGEGMTEFRCGDHIGYGLSEYLDQVG
ncbi:MAG TPA: hypothetical protein VFC53_00875 [Dehalococcoidia bacterium]|nr:hypothetical protein [Dehalococcoidia bacterium]